LGSSIDFVGRLRRWYVPAGIVVVASCRGPLSPASSTTTSTRDDDAIFPIRFFPDGRLVVVMMVVLLLGRGNKNGAREQVLHLLQIRKTPTLAYITHLYSCDSINEVNPT
jgi:hypothetical protein